MRKPECSNIRFAFGAAKSTNCFSSNGRAIPVRLAFKNCLAAMLVVVIVIGWNMSIGQAQQLPQNPAGLEQKAQRLPEPSLKYRTAQSEKGATQLLRKDSRRDGEEPPTPREKPAVSQRFP